MIKSKFYLIRGDGEPIYVGFTNRPIKQRFSEHKADKDFSDYEEVTIEKIDQLNYEFTWNEDILYKNANEVSVREAQLIVDYGTQDSKYQKATGGGQVWLYEKYFVKANKDNPKFGGMSGVEIENYITLENNRIQKLRDYVARTESIYLIKQKNYIGNTMPSYLIKQKNYVKLTIPSYLIKQKNYIHDTMPIYLRKQKNYISHTMTSYLMKQKNYIGHTRS